MPLQRLEPYAPKGARTVLRGQQRSNALLLPDQDHRHIKSRTNVMPGFKRFRSAATTISGIELTHRIRKGQFDLAKLGLKDAAAPAVWNAVPSTR
ncbi:DDE-type integrase/transposase/recombinase [Paraburkholderia sp. RL17-337-BIB-A]